MARRGSGGACATLHGGKERAEAQADYQGRAPSLKRDILTFLTSIADRV